MPLDSQISHLPVLLKIAKAETCTMPNIGHAIQYAREKEQDKLISFKLLKD